MTNVDTVSKIAKMNESELLDFVVGNANYITDSYYIEFARAIYARHHRLMEDRYRRPGKASKNAEPTLPVTSADRATVGGEK